MTKKTRKEDALGQQEGFTINWFKKVSEDEEDAIRQAVEKLAPILDECREFILKYYRRRARVRARIGYPFADPIIDLEVWYDATTPTCGVHIYKFRDNEPIGAVQLNHENTFGPADKSVSTHAVRNLQPNNPTHGR
jgi:hypothetical protein